jgi:tetratricopeptide (TPR) repeat protein
MAKIFLIRSFLGLALLLFPLTVTTAFAAQESEEEEEEEGEEDPNVPQKEDDDDVDNWSDEGVVEKKVEKKVEEKKRDLPPEPKRNGTSGNWYEVTVECARCPNLLDQSFGLEDSMVMREFFDFIQIDSNRKSAKFVFPSIGENRPMGVSDKGKRLLIWQYTVDVGTRLTDTYATVWDLTLQAKDGLLYGRRYEVQAWSEEAYEDWERGYQAKKSFISSSKLLSYADLAPVKALDTDNNRFQVGGDSRISFVGYAAFVRSDVDNGAIEDEQSALRQKAEKEAKRLRDQKDEYSKGQSYLDDKDWESALESFEKAASLGMESLDLHYELGFTYYKVGNLSKAKEHYSTILDTDPRDTDVRYNLARIYEKERDWDAAIREYQAILKFDPDDQVSRERLNLLKTAREMQR